MSYPVRVNNRVTYQYCHTFSGVKLSLNCLKISSKIKSKKYKGIHNIHKIINYICNSEINTNKTLFITIPTLKGNMKAYVEIQRHKRYLSHASINN